MLKDGKLFGKINIVDCFVLLIILLLIIGAVMKFGKFNSGVEVSSNQIIEYQMKIKNVRDFTIDAMQSGDIVYDSQTGNSIGKITNVEKEDAITYDFKSTGELIEVHNSDRCDAIITIETDGTVDENGYYANKIVELKVDSTKIIETKYVKTSGTIVDIKIKNMDSGEQVNKVEV